MSVLTETTKQVQVIRPQQRKRLRSNLGTALLLGGPAFLLLLVFLIEVAGLLVIEMVTLSRGVWPITYYIRCAYNAAGVETALGAAAISFLVGRWFWLPRRKHARTGT